MTPPWILPVISVAMTVILAMLAYLVKGLLAWGKTTSTLQEQVRSINEKFEHLTNDVADIRREMLRPSDLQSSILGLQVEMLKDFERRSKNSPLAHGGV